MKSPLCRYLCGLLLFGSNGIVASHIALSSQEIVLLRSALGSALLLCLFWGTHGSLPLRRHRGNVFFIACSGVAMAADWLLLFEAYAQIGVSLGMLINYCGPAVVILVSVLFLHEELTARKLCALLASLSGIFLISGEAVTAGVRVSGLLCALFSALAYAAMVLLNKQAQHLTGLANASLQLYSAFLAIALFAAFSHGLNLSLRGEDWLPVFWLGCVNTGLGCYLYFSSIGRLPVQTVAVCGYLEPLSAVMLSFFILGESLLPLQLLGALLIMGSALWNELSV